MTQEIIAMAREAGMKSSIGKIDKQGNYHPHKNALFSAVPIEWLERFYQLARNKALEDAAKKCEYVGPQGNPMALINQAFAQEIRNMKEKNHG